MSNVPDRHLCHYPVWQSLWLMFWEQTAAAVHDVIIPTPSVICYHTFAHSYHHNKRFDSHKCAPTPCPHDSLMPSCELTFISDLSHDTSSKTRHKSLLPLRLLWHPLNRGADVLAGQLGITIWFSSWPVAALKNVLFWILLILFSTVTLTAGMTKG